MADRINLSTTAETNVDWYSDGEPANAAVLNRPIQDVAEVVNAMMDEYETTFSSSTTGASIEVYNGLTGDTQTQTLPGLIVATSTGMTNGPSGNLTGTFIQFGNNDDDLKFQMATTMGGTLYTRLQWGVGNWGSWKQIVSYADLTTLDYLPKSSIVTTSSSPSGTVIPKSRLKSINGIVVASFGETSGATTYNDFNTTPTNCGWSFVNGTTNGPSHGGTKGGYRCLVAMGEDAVNNGLELLIPRTVSGADGTYIWTRQADSDTWRSWSKMNAGNSDTVGGYTAAQLTANAAHDIHFICGYSPDGVGEDIRVQTYGTIVLARAMTITGAQGYCGLAPTGSALIVDVLKNGVTVFTTKPQFAVSTNTMTAGVLNSSLVSCTAGDVISFIVTQIGSTIRGQQMRFTIKGN